MANLAQYFEQRRYKAKWNIGDRVYGKWNKIPFVGTVGNDTVISEEQGPRVSVHLDLPFKYQDKVYRILFVKPDDIKAFK